MSDITEEGGGVAVGARCMYMNRTSYGVHATEVVKTLRHRPSLPVNL